MAVTLVSTGIQFPDASIQTTAASGSSWVYLSTTTASNSQTVDVENAFSSTYSTYAIVVSDMYPTNNTTELRVRFKLGGAYSTATYNYMGLDNTSYAATTFSGFGTENSTFGLIARYMYGNVAARTMQSVMFISNPSSTSTYKMVFGTGTYYQDNNSIINQTYAIGNQSTTSALTGVRFFMNTGNISAGTFRLYGIKAS